MKCIKFCSTCEKYICCEYYYTSSIYTVLEVLYKLVHTVHCTKSTVKTCTHLPLHLEYCARLRSMFTVLWVQCKLVQDCTNCTLLEVLYKITVFILEVLYKITVFTVRYNLTHCSIYQERAHFKTKILFKIVFTVLEVLIKIVFTVLEVLYKIVFTVLEVLTFPELYWWLRTLAVHSKWIVNSNVILIDCRRYLTSTWVWFENLNHKQATKHTCFVTRFCPRNGYYIITWHWIQNWIV